MKALFKILLIVFLISGIVACGSRKTQKTEVKEEIKTEIEASTKTDIKTETDKKTDTKTESDISESLENLTPIDPDKPMKKTVEEKDGKKITTWENASVNSGTKTDKSKKSESVDEVVKSDFKRESDFKTVQEVKKSDKAKVTESNKGFDMSYWWLLLLLIPLAVWKFYNIKNKFE